MQSQHRHTSSVNKIGASELAIPFRGPTAAKLTQIAMPQLANFHCLETQYIHYTSGDIGIHINFTEIMCFYKMSAKWLSAPWDVGSLDVGSVESARWQSA